MDEKLYVIATPMIDQCMERWGKKCEVVSNIKGEKLIDITFYIHLLKGNQSYFMAIMLQLRRELVVCILPQLTEWTIT